MATRPARGSSSATATGCPPMPTIIRDNAGVAAAIDECFGRKPRIGVFHSTSALTAILPGAERHGYSALVLFDPPIFHSGRDRRDVVAGERLARRLARTARSRRERFGTWEEPAECVFETVRFLERRSLI